MFTHEALKAAIDHCPDPQFQFLRNYDQAVTRNDHSAKADVVHAAEADHFGTDKIVPLRMEAAHLSGCLAHDNARHKGQAGHVPASPELMVSDIFVANADAALEVVVDNRRELLHFEALWVVAANLIDIRDDVIEVVLGKIDDQILARHRTLTEAFAEY